MFTKMLILAGAILLAAAAPASAGGWAASTLDETPAQFVAGQDQQVGFTIRQHGQTPVNPDSGDVGIRLTSATGQKLTFLAQQQGPVGHFVATVRAPTTGTWQWEVLQGWFEPQSLGAIEVVDSAAAAAVPAAQPPPASSSDGTSWWRIAAVAFAVVVGLVVLVDVVVGRRRPRASARVIDRRTVHRRTGLRLTGLLAAAVALTAALWPSRPAGTSAVAAAPAEVAVDGATTFRVKGCATCHDGPDSGARVPVGPSLADLRATAGNRVARLSAEDYVRQSVVTPQAFVVSGYDASFTQMPTLPVTDADLDALVRYLLG